MNLCFSNKLTVSKYNAYHFDGFEGQKTLAQSIQKGLYCQEVVWYTETDLKFRLSIYMKIDKGAGAVSFVSKDYGHFFGGRGQINFWHIGTLKWSILLNFFLIKY